ncbi:MAG: zinc-binding alcohol dehydrogenase family protein [Bacteroidota bacterium]
MQTLVCVQPGKFEYGESEITKPGKEESLLRIKRVGICGTDLHAFEGTQPYFEYPRILGHELAAEFIEGDAEGFQAGELVTIMPYFYCGKCIACRNGKTNCCTSIKVCGVHQDGGMREYFTVPSYSLLHSEGLDADALALTEPLAIGAHAVRRAAVQPGEFALIIGAGPIGLGIMEFLKIAGAQVIAMDINESRLNFCRNKLGIPFIINAANENVNERLRQITSNDMPTLVIDATGNRKAIDNAFQYMAHGGKYVLVGLQKEIISFSHPEFHKREATLMSSRNATKEDFQAVIQNIKDGNINPSVYITHRVSFSEVKDSFESWLRPETGVIKALVSL